MSKLPETLVVFATVHGVIPVEEGEATLFTVPEGIKITRIMAARPGVCNITQESRIEQLVKDMNQVFKETVTPDKIDRIVSTIKPATGELVKRLSGDIKSADDELFQRFLRSHIKTPTVKEFLPGETMIDKFLVRNAEEGTDSAYDFKLNIMNLPGNPDLFDEIIFGRTGPSVALRTYALAGREGYLSSILDILHDRGVKHIVFFDFTCSTFDGVMTGREERALRRSIIQKGVGKRKTRRPKNKTKTRKAKKRRSLWSY